MAESEGNAQWLTTGAQRPAVLIVGHSHILAPLSGYPDLSEEDRSRFAFLWSEDRTRWPKCSDEYWEFAAQHAAPSIAIIWNGNQHNAHFLLEFDRPIRLAGTRHEQPGVRDGHDAVVVSETTFEELWKADLVEMKRVIGLLSGQKRCFVLGTPPPKDAHEIEALLFTDPFFVQRATEIGKPVNELRVSPNEFRIALWRQIQAGMHAAAQELGVDFVGVPPTCLTAGGLLPAGFGAPDATHANGRYGIELLRALSSRLEQSK